MSTMSSPATPSLSLHHDRGYREPRIAVASACRFAAGCFRPAFKDRGKSACADADLPHAGHGRIRPCPDVHVREDTARRWRSRRSGVLQSRRRRAHVAGKCAGLSHCPQSRRGIHCARARLPADADLAPVPGSAHGAVRCDPCRWTADRPGGRRFAGDRQGGRGTV